MSTPTEAKFACACPHCGKSLRVPASAAGRRAKCPRCGEAFEISAPPADADPAAELSGLQHGESVEPPSPVPSPAPRAPRPQSAVSPSDVARSVGGALTPLAGGGSRFVLGCAGSALGAAVGAAIWFGVAHTTNYEVGWIAWGVGGLAGLGMMLGNRGGSGPIPGAVAALMAVLGIVSGKLLVFNTVIAPFAAAIHQDSASPREDLASMTAAENLEAQGKDESLSDEEWEKAHAAEVERIRPEIAGLSDAQVRDRLAERKAALEKEFRAMAGRQFFASMFGFMDIVFFALAMMTAYKLGARSAAAAS